MIEAPALELPVVATDPQIDGKYPASLQIRCSEVTAVWRIP
jgi:hypothetical protein